MREIKFKGKRKDNGEWVYGHYIVCDYKTFIVDKECCSSTYDNGRSVGIDYDELIEVISETVGQFTGLKDKFDKPEEKPTEKTKTKPKGKKKDDPKPETKPEPEKEPEPATEETKAEPEPEKEPVLPDKWKCMRCDRLLKDNGEDVKNKLCAYCTGKIVELS